MCSPAAAVIGGGALLQGYAAQQAGDANAAALYENALIAEKAAVDSLDRGSVEAGKAKMGGSQMIGKARVAAAAAGVDVQSSSVIDVIGQTRMMSEFDAKTIYSNAERESWQYKMQARSLRAQARAESAKADMAMFTSLLGAGGMIAMSSGGGGANFSRGG
jgi:hypothetical protein